MKLNAQERMTPFAAEVSASAPEREIARDLALRTLLIAPVMLAVGAIFWGWAGLWSSGYGLAIVAVNFLVGAAIITWSAKISPAVMFGAVMFGFIARLGIITAAVLPIRNAEWFEGVPFAIALLTAHIGLLAWESRHIAASLAYPGLKPGSALFSSAPTDPTNNLNAERSA